MANLKSNVWHRLLKNPLMHFIAAGIAVYGVVSLSQDPQSVEDTQNNIIVERSVLLKQLQYMSKTFEPEYAQSQFDNLGEDGLQKLIDQYMTEEALYREAKLLGLGNNDKVIKKRMAEKMDFIVQGGSADTIEVSEQELTDFYNQNPDKFKEPGSVTFTHVFIANEQRSTEQVQQMTSQLAAQLASENIAFTDAVRFGERYPLGLNFVEKTQDDIAGFFGDDMANAVIKLPVNESKWQGPYQSKLGTHFVLLTKKVDAKLASFDEVKGNVRRLVQRKKQMVLRDKAITKLLERYEVINTLERKNTAANSSTNTSFTDATRG